MGGEGESGTGQLEEVSVISYIEAECMAFTPRERWPIYHPMLLEG